MNECFPKRQAVSVIYLFAVSSAKVSCRPLVRVGCNTHARKSDDTLSGFHGEYVYLLYTLTVLPCICLCAGCFMRFRPVLDCPSSLGQLLRTYTTAAGVQNALISYGLSDFTVDGNQRGQAGETRMRRMWGFDLEANHGLLVGLCFCFDSFVTCSRGGAGRGATASTSAWWLTLAAGYRTRRGREGGIFHSHITAHRNQFKHSRSPANMPPDMWRTRRSREESARCVRVCTLLVIGSNVSTLDILFFEAAPKGFYSFVYVLFKNNFTQRERIRRSPERRE